MKKYTIKKTGTKYRIRRIIVLVILILIIYLLIIGIKGIIGLFKMNQKENENNTEKDVTESTSPVAVVSYEREITEWNLLLVNSKNLIPEDFKIELAKIDDTRSFDARAIEQLNKMLNDARKSGITNIWVQSAYRSVDRQKELYEESVKKYINQGKTREEAEKLTEKTINKPGSSEHNIGLAVDFNDVTNEFESTKAFEWLTKNAQEYGFILRYPKDKESITGISYESWHWRYIGTEHAKKINELNMCLEEYIDYLKKQPNEEV